jgi:hypothetical protein
MTCSSRPRKTVAICVAFIKLSRSELVRASSSARPLYSAFSVVSVFVDALQLFAARFQRFAGAAKFLVERLELLVVGFQLFGRGLVLFDRVQQSGLPCKRSFQLLHQGNWFRVAAQGGQLCAFLRRQLVFPQEHQQIAGRGLARG